MPPEQVNPPVQGAERTRTAESGRLNRRNSVRRLALALVPNVEELAGDEQDAIYALALHLRCRFEQDEHEPLDADGRTFLTVSYMQRLLWNVGAHCSGEKAAVGALRWLCASGVLEDTGEVKKPRRRPNRAAAREKFCHGDGAERGEGGGDAQPSLARSYWWPVYRVVPLSAVLRWYESLQGAYARFLEFPQALASLSAWAERQGLISRSRGRRGVRTGSVQYVFAHSGPP
jgi:hypothetical protein